MDARIALTLLLLTGCTSLPSSQPEAPIVKVSDVKPLNLSIGRQKLEFELDVFNPNDHAIVIDELVFVAGLADETLLEGASHNRTTLPAMANTTMYIDVAASISDALKYMSKVLSDGDETVDYGIRGTVKLARWPFSIPFQVDGEIETGLRQDAARP